MATIAREHERLLRAMSQIREIKCNNCLNLFDPKKVKPSGGLSLPNLCQSCQDADLSLVADGFML